MRAREPTLRIVCPHCHEAADFGVAKLIASKGECTCPKCIKATKATAQFLDVPRAMT